MPDGKTTVIAMEAFITAVGTVITGAVGWISTIVGVIVSTPPLMVPFVLGIGFTVVRLFKALR